MSEANLENFASTSNQQNGINQLLKLISYLGALHIQERYFPYDKYEYNYTYLNPLAITNVPENKVLQKIFGLPFPNLPQGQMPSLQWIGKVAFRLVITVINGSLAKKSEPSESAAILSKLQRLENQEESSDFLVKLKSVLEEIDQEMQVDDKLQKSYQKFPERTKSNISGLIENQFQEIRNQTSKSLNLSRQELDKDLDSSEKSAIASLEEIIKYTAKLAELAENKAPIAKSLLQLSADSSNLVPYNNQFQVIPKPAISNQFQQDLIFAYLQVAGYNPVVLEQINQLDSRIEITAAQYSDIATKFGVSDSLDSAVKDGRLYLADYSILEGLVNGTYPTQQKYLAVPIALFAVPPVGSTSRSLFPVAISYNQTSISNQRLVFTPLDADDNGEPWMTAKNIVEMANSNYHELISHLGRTHLVVEAFVVPTNNLPDNHSLKCLLKPHLEGTVLINYGAYTLLVAPGGAVDSLLVSSVGADQSLAAKATQSYLFNFNDIAFPKTLENRGVTDKTKLPTYPYRDDGLLIWNAIESWVNDYFNLFYSSDAEVLNDADLQTWASTLVSHEGGRLQNFGDDGQGQIKTISYLVQAVSTIIFTASAQHAAVNFPQKEFMMYSPGFPLARYLPAPTNTQETQGFIEGLPPLNKALDQINTLYLLGSVYYTKLGYYSESAFINPNQVQSALDKFQKNLDAITEEITQRNSQPDRLIAYEFLLPAKIPQSINI
ncbi:MAG: lipoxygenase [Nostocales cyanobacterium]|nr:MAG: lipoxygenase [Nostocales cyanobacterium]TAF12329.1 MAG: lipoxygenase [Nostocales cyanobacterium]